jgi:hypothetical protein
MVQIYFVKSLHDREKCTAVPHADDRLLEDEFVASSLFVDVDSDSAAFVDDDDDEQCLELASLSSFLRICVSDAGSD